MMLRKEHLEFLKMLDISVDISNTIDDTTCDEIEEKVSTYLQKCGFDENYSLTKNGILCEEILDILEE